MRQIEAEIDRCLTLLRNKIRERGFTQLEVQEALGWGRSYISQLLTKQKSLRVEQVLLILQVIRVDPRDFFAELYSMPGPLYAASRPPRPLPSPAPAKPQQDPFGELRTMLDGLVRLLVEKQLISGEELTVAAEAAEREAL